MEDRKSSMYFTDGRSIFRVWAVNGEYSGERFDTNSRTFAPIPNPTELFIEAFPMSESELPEKVRQILFK